MITRCFYFTNFVQFLLAAVVLKHSKTKDVSVNVFTDNIVRTTSEKFLSITLGTIQNWQGWRSIKGSPKLRLLATHLSPAYLRIGGTTQDRLHWEKDGIDRNTYNASQLQRLHDFAQATKLHLIFGFPALPRTVDGSWDSTNAIQLLEYIKQKGYSMSSWELGNEPDMWPVHNMTNISAVQFTKDVQHLKTILKPYGKYKIYGPDIAHFTEDHDFFQRYLEKIPSGVLDAVTYHHYYKNSLNATLEDFINVTILDKYMNYSQKAVKLVYSHLGENTPVWLGETSNMYNSGAPGLSDTFAAGFMWLDKLGITALANHTVVCRQSIYNGYYSLLDAENMYPLPDYWSSVLYKRLVGTEVLMVENSLDEGRKARIYAHCTKVTKYYGYKDGAITLIVLNLHRNETIAIGLKGKLRILNVDQFLLQPGTQNITSRSTKLNGKLLELHNNQLPELKATSQEQPFSVPPLTYGYFVISQANVKACLAKNN